MRRSSQRITARRTSAATPPTTPPATRRRGKVSNACSRGATLDSLAPVLEEEPPLPVEAELRVPAEVKVVGRPSLPVPVTTTVRKLVMVEGSRVVTGGGAEDEVEEEASLDGPAEVVEEDSGSVVVDEEEVGAGVVVVLELEVVVEEIVVDEEELLELEVETAWQEVDTSPGAVERDTEVTVDRDSETEPCCVVRKRVSGTERV